MKSIRFNVPAVPVAQPRPRAVAAGKHARMMGPPHKHPVHTFRAAVAMAAAGAYKGPPLAEPLQAVFIFVMPRRAGLRWKTKPMPRLPYAVKKNDWDNLGKGVCDALEGTLFDNDGWLVDVRVQRWIAAGDEQPHVEILIEAFDGAGPVAQVPSRRDVVKGETNGHVR